MKPQIALQLWSIQDTCKDNFYEALKEVKRSGYDGVEFAGYHGRSAAEVKSYLEELGLQVAASHLSFEVLQNDFEKTLAFEKEIGTSRIVIPYATFQTIEAWQAFIAEMEEIAKKAAEEGFEFFYHNHANELTEIPGCDILHEMVQRTKHINLEVDLYWLADSGVDAFPWLEAHKDRIGLFHMKDMQDTPRESTEIGSGILPMIEYVQMAKRLDIPWLIVEQEEFQNYPPLEATAIDCQQLRAMVDEVYSKS
ncbi:sugar phosphate isomerase/epimerase [Paenibacillus sp. MBLB2552]|uniref:Sugar phosphate isomerase/epimerase n=1 Tax=Paenibacillus mellifer TaxID=2937794 RepID=A0A9X2BSL7_9BACL|nr:sugar phosphate isomerase/epimerase [Paenibacillus mellifer]MCK8486906.1 sugar phosphate isomerase/epimerase [Paenibacillus mellifer]